jgi:isopentenyl-diphosphate delta-isomerase
MSTTATITAPPTGITRENVLRLFPEVNTAVIGGKHASATQDNDMAGYDEEQIKLMDEVCIVLDEDDVPIGSASKKVCECPCHPAGMRHQERVANTPIGHLMENIDQGLLHRAFSVFLFDSQNRLLLQQRATEKITFPDMWTNTCCSHPLGIPGETGVGLDASVQGVRRAAQRKLDQELGIKAAQVPIDNFQFLTRIHYKSPSDGKWGEHESEWPLLASLTSNTRGPNSRCCS